MPASSPMSTIAAPMIVPSAQMKAILRNGSCGPRNGVMCPVASFMPCERSHGVSHVPIAPTTIAGMPMRAPTIMPAPSVEAE